MIPTSGAASFIGLHGAGDHAVGVVRQLAGGVLLGAVDVREDGDGRDAERAGLLAAAAQSFTDRRLIPGIEPTGTVPSPSCTTIDQIRSAGVSTVSRTSRRIQSAWRRRRMRSAG
jgi:hypothetical protein